MTGENCPIHNCFSSPNDNNVFVDNSEVEIYSEDRVIGLPKYVKKFVEDFDNGKYPNLIKRG